MYDEYNEAIRWSYCEDLVKAQYEEKLHLGFCATNRRLNWSREAAQTFSKGTARDMEYLRESQYLLQVTENIIECSSKNQDAIVREMVQ